jgi:hypothetical protein
MHLTDERAVTSFCDYLEASEKLGVSVNDAMISEIRRHYPSPACQEIITAAVERYRARLMT